METLTRRRLAQIMKKHNRIKIVDAYNFIDFIIVVVKEALLRGNSVKIRGFGTFLIKHKYIIIENIFRIHYGIRIIQHFKWLLSGYSCH
jgi:hypothetical protein